ncbi:MAG: cobalamin biosynthesis protein CbiD [Lachnospiraceae bacterium]|nr:cobalamin biosynthesis protein CbiD [Lachnospiraceae bacterium]
MNPVNTKLRKGYTTGSCAAAAAGAASYMLLTGKTLVRKSIMTPAGIVYDADIEDINRGEGWVSCAVRKDSGDDPDITNGLLIYARVSIVENDVSDKAKQGMSVEITGGRGIGVVTKPGLDRPVGSYAINSIPLAMIREEVIASSELAEYTGSINVEISAPDGEEIAARTFNPRLGIKGGISIIGTSGIVEPMSSRALLDTIRLELGQRKGSGYDYAVIAPGNYGRELLLNEFGYDIDKSIKCSNYIGETVDMAYEAGFKRLLLVGHIGKLVKVAGGIMNTHSREADCRMEILTALAAIHGADRSICTSIMECVNTEEALNLIDKAGLLKPVMDEVIKRIEDHLADRIRRRTDIKDGSCSKDMQACVVVYSNEYGILGMSEGVKEWFTLLEQEQAQQI